MPTKTAIRVISLERSTDRRDTFSQMAAATKVDWDFFPACTGLKPPLTYDRRAATRRSGRPMTPAEIGCYASHFKLWEWLAGSDYDQLIILEDDVIVHWGVIEQLAATKFSDHRVDLLRLFATHPFKWKFVKHQPLFAGRHLIRIAGMTYGMQGYLITRAAARSLVARYAAIRAPVDWVLNWYWEHGIFNYCLFPSPLIDRLMPSTIGHCRHDETSTSPLDRFLYALTQQRDKLKRAFVERLYFLRSNRPRNHDHNRF